MAIQRVARSADTGAFTATGAKAFKKAVKAHTEKTTKSKDAALKALKDAGILTPSGKLASRYK